MRNDIATHLYLAPITEGILFNSDRFSRHRKIESTFPELAEPTNDLTAIGWLTDLTDLCAITRDASFI